MTEPLKVMVGPSGHYHQLKSREMKYQKSKPAKPIWRVLVPIGDATLTERMAELINERLARTGKGISCQIAPATVILWK